MYCTPKRFRHAGLGIALSGLTDIELRATLVRAANRTDAYCNVPMLPSRYSFKGGSVVGEQHGWTDGYTRRIYLSAHPIRTVSAVRIFASNNLFVDFDEDDFFINYVEGYIELINFAITKAGIWGEANVPQLGLSQPVSSTDYTYGYDYVVTDEALLPTASGEGVLDYQEYLAENGFWTDADVTVKKNNVIETTGFMLDRETGLVRFEPALSASDEVTATYHYAIPPEIVEGSNLIAKALLGERTLTAKDMTGIESIEVEELRVRRTGAYARSARSSEANSDVPEEARSFLDGYKFWTVR